MGLTVYLSGEIHTDWRDQITSGASGLDVVFTGPVTDHEASDDCGVRIPGAALNRCFNVFHRVSIAHVICYYSMC